MKWNRQKLVTVSFIALCLGSVAYLSAITLNYLNYYPALGTLTARVDSVSVVPGSNYSRIDSRITVSNPSGYVGVVLSEAYTRMFFTNENNGSLLFANVEPTGDQIIGIRLSPHSAISQNIITQLYPSQASSLKSFTSSPKGIVANVTLTALLTTFLTPAVGQYSIIVSSGQPIGV